VKLNRYKVILYRVVLNFGTICPEVQRKMCIVHIESLH